jgi:hypothetical protein
MVDAAFNGCPAPDGCLQGSNSDPGVHRPADRVTDDLSRPCVEDRGEIDEAAGNGDVGQVGNLQLVWAIGNNILGQVWEDRSGVVAIRGDDVAPPSFGLQDMLAHQAAELLVVHHHALVAECRADAPVAITLELVADRADPGQNLFRRQRNR